MARIDNVRLIADASWRFTDIRITRAVNCDGLDSMVSTDQHLRGWITTTTIYIDLDGVLSYDIICSPYVVDSLCM